MDRKIYMCLALTALLGPGVVQAEEEMHDNALPVMKEVVVTATKTREQRKDISNSVIVIDKMEVMESPAQSVGELLADEPGIDWRTLGNYGGAAEEIKIRGMDSDETQVLLNGININSPSLGRADVSIVPMNVIEKVEVVKGAGSFLYGSGAMAGTVNIITKDPKRDSISAKASAAYGTENTYQISAEHGMFPANSNLGYYLTASRQETDGFRDNGDLEQNDASLKLLLDKGELLNISLYGDYIDREFGVPGVKPPVGTVDHFVNGVKFYSSESASTVNQGETDDSHAVLKLESRPLTWLFFRFKSDYLYSDSVDTERFNADSWTSLAGEGRKTRVTNKVSNVEGNLEINPLARASFLVGADYRHHDWKTETSDLDTSGDAKSSQTNDADLYTKSVFAELQYRPYEYGKITAGIRQEVHSTFGSENIPHFGLVVNPLEHTVLKINHGKFFKAPTPNDLFWPEDDFVRGNPDLEAQTGWHTDATVEQSFFFNKLFVALSYFDWSVDGKITWAENPLYPGPFGNKWTPTNLNKSEGEGWEAGMELNPFHSMSFSLSYTYTDAKEEANGLWRKAQYTAENHFKGKVAWRSEYGLIISGVVRYVSDRDFYRSATDTVPTDTLDSYYTVDLKMEKQVFDNWSVVLQGNNLFDANYDTYVGSFVDNSGSLIYSRYPGAGRSFLLSVAYEL